MYTEVEGVEYYYASWCEKHLELREWSGRKKRRKEEGNMKEGWNRVVQMAEGQL